MLDTEEFNSFANQVIQQRIPPAAPNEQLRDIVVKYLQDNPEKRRETARFLVLSAYRDAFPCQ
ncbi:Rap1a/Tai family immunity protein [Rhodobacteraceae bacterium KMM 6894]|nr:Rap1a/Tai family immunity protein [Rhodobacteraceae bacterium KMM 6894]